MSLPASPDRRKVSFTPQRSYSCGDLSPTDTEKGWGDENDDDWSDSSHEVGAVASHGLLGGNRGELVLPF